MNDSLLELLNGTEVKPMVSLVDIATSTTILLAFASATHFHALDYAAIGAYFILLAGVGIWSSKRIETGSVSAIFLARRTMNWIPVGASLFAFELGTMLMIIILGWIFLPVYIAAGVSTMPGYLRKRLGGQRVHLYLSSLSLVLYIFTKISADLYSGAIFIKQSLNLDLSSSVSVLLLISLLNCISGGLAALMWTDAAQTVLMILGSLLLSILTLKKVGGYRQLIEDFPLLSHPNDDIFVNFYCTDSTATTNQTYASCSEVSRYYKNLFRPATDPELPWPGMLAGMFILAIWHWCTDEVIVQRDLSAKSLSQGKAGCLLAALLKTSSLFLIILPGMAARLLWPNELGCSNPTVCNQICGNEQGCSNLAYPLLVLRVMPLGATGAMFSALLAAVISSLTTIFTSASTIFILDIYKYIRKDASDTEQIIVGRFFVLALVVLSCLWIRVIDSAGSHFFFTILAITSYLAPPVCAVYILAVFWYRVNEPGAFWGLMLGLLIGLCRFVCDFLYDDIPCGAEGYNPSDTSLLRVHYLYFAVLLFTITSFSTAFVSLLTEPIGPVHLHRLTFWSKFSQEIRADLCDVSELKLKSNPSSEEVCRDESGFTNCHNWSNCAFDASSEPVAVNIPASTDTVNSTAKAKSDKSYFKWLLLALCCIFSSQRKSPSSTFQISNSRRESKVATTCMVENVPMDAKEMAIEESAAACDDPQWASWLNLGALVVLFQVAFLFGHFA